MNKPAEKAVEQKLQEVKNNNELSDDELDISAGGDIYGGILVPLISPKEESQDCLPPADE